LRGSLLACCLPACFLQLASCYAAVASDITNLHITNLLDTVLEYRRHMLLLMP
jgi:hypothetical protein